MAFSWHSIEFAHHIQVSVTKDINICALNYIILAGIKLCTILQELITT